MADRVLQNQDKDGMLRRALERIIQLYTDKSHFVYELLQNAEDAGATRIRFLQYSDRLEVLHDGHPFTQQNLTGLCDIGKSDKINDLNQIGEFGVGFKSVFGICETVRLYSHPLGTHDAEIYERFSVEIRDFTHPVDIEDAEIPEGYTTRYVFPYHVGATFSGFQTIDQLNTALSTRLQHLGITTLLFMKSLQSIDYEIALPSLRTSGSYRLEKQRINDHCVLVSASGETASEDKNGSKNNRNKNEQEKVQYLIFSSPVSTIQAGRTVDIAFTVRVTKDGHYHFLPSKYPFISVYFPTETESKLNFIVQGPYRTTPNRSSVPADDKDNKELAEQTARLLRESILELRDAGKLNLSFLNILPFTEEAFDSAPLFSCMYDVVYVLVQQEPVLVCEDGSCQLASHVKIARGREFAEVFTNELLTELLNDGNEYHWLPLAVSETAKQYKDLYDFLTNDLRIGVLRPEHMLEPINRNPLFFKRRDDEWLIRMYNMYSRVGAAFTKSRGGSNMLTARFIKTSKGEFLQPYVVATPETDYRYWSFVPGYRDATYLPNVFLPMDNGTTLNDIPFVDAEMLRQCPQFFKEVLGLRQPGAFEFFVHDYEQRGKQGGRTTDEQHISDVKQLLKYLHNPDYNGKIQELIKNYLLVRCVEGNVRTVANPHRESVYFSKADNGTSIEMYLHGVADASFVDEEFYFNAGITRDQLRELGIGSDLTIGSGITSGVYYSGNRGAQPSWQSGAFLWKLDLLYLDEVLEYMSSHPFAMDSMAKSNYIFRFLQGYQRRQLTGTVYISGNTVPNKYGEKSKILNSLLDQTERLRRKPDGSYEKWRVKWLYTKSQQLVAPNQISRYDLNTSIYGEIDCESELYDLLGFVKSDRERMETIAREYDKISDDKKEQYFELELSRRYGVSVSDLNKVMQGKNPKRVDKGQNQTTGEFEFPQSNIVSWDRLRRHITAEFCYAVPVQYSHRVRSVRVSQSPDSAKAYLKDMYRISGQQRYVCQSCHQAVTNIESCQIAREPKWELDAMHLCMCPNCASEFRKICKNSRELESFLAAIARMRDSDIESENPVEVTTSESAIWFTQVHIAEIRELLALQKRAEDKDEPEKRREMQRANDARRVTPSAGLRSTATSNQRSHAAALVVNRSIERKVAARPSNNKAQKNTHNQSKKQPTARKYITSQMGPLELINQMVRHDSYGIGSVTKCSPTEISVHFYSGVNATFSLKSIEKERSMYLVL